MVWKLFRKKGRPTAVGTAAERAGELFDDGLNCAQAVLRATTGREDAELMAMADAFGGGIGDSRCLCGALSGGVMALGLAGCGRRSRELLEAFTARHRVTCCRGLSAPYRWLSRDHRANCRRLTVETAGIVADLMS